MCGALNPNHMKYKITLKMSCVANYYFPVFAGRE